MRRVAALLPVRCAVRLLSRAVSGGQAAAPGAVGSVKSEKAKWRAGPLAESTADRKSVATETKANGLAVRPSSGAAQGITKKPSTRLDSKGAGDIAPDAEGRARPRRFDAHTFSIWARSMSARSGRHGDALRMLLRRADAYAARAALADARPLYNTALDICGHAGMLAAAGAVLGRMVARDVPSDQRTLASLLNCVAVAWRMRVSSVDDSAREPDVGRRDTPGGATQPPGSRNSTRKAPGQEHMEDAPLPSSGHVTGWGEDGLDADGFIAQATANAGVHERDFGALSTAQDAACLALRLYASWRACAPEEERSPHALNALLKVLRAARGGHLVRPLLAMHGIGDDSSGSSTHAEQHAVEPDDITHTSAALACVALDERVRSPSNLREALNTAHVYLQQVSGRNAAFVAACLAVVRETRPARLAASGLRASARAELRRLGTARRRLLKECVVPAATAVLDLPPAVCRAVHNALSRLGCVSEAASFASAHSSAFGKWNSSIKPCSARSRSKTAVAA